MPIGSYVEENNYNLVKDIRPFDMPYEAYAKEISTKQQYWRIGADRIKSIYDQAAGLNPQYTQGKEYLKGFMQDATKNLDKLSKSDLSVLDNSQQAARIFKPLFDVSNPLNAALLKDSQLNEHYKKQQEISDMYRTKDGGKEWNVNNEIYYRDGQMKYQQDAQSGDYSTIDDNFQNRKSYIPYYDYKDELKEIQENCKGFTLDTQDVNPQNGMYFNKEHRSGCDPQRLAIAFQTGLSGRAKQQMHIDGYSAFRGNEDVLVRKFKEVSVDRAGNEVLQIKAAIAGLSAGKITKDEQAKIDDLNAMLAVREPRYKQALIEYNNAVKGNPMEYVKKNFDRLAGQIYFDELTNSLGESFRTDDTKKILLPNAVAMQHAGFLQQTATQLRGFQHDQNMKAVDWFYDQKKAEMDWGYKEKEILLEAQKSLALARLKGELSGESAVLPTALTPGVFDPKSAPVRTEQDFKEQELAPIQQQNQIDYKTLIDYIHDKYPQLTGQKAIAAFLNEHNSKKPVDQDPIITRLYKAFDESSNSLKSKINMIEAVDEQFKESHPELYGIGDLSDDKKTSNKFSVQSDELGLFGNKTNHIEVVAPPMSEKDVRKVLLGENVNGYTIKKIGGGGGITNTDISIGNYELFFNGKRILGTGSETDPLYGLLKSVTKKQDTKINKLNELKAQVYTDDWYSNGNYTRNTLTIKKDSYQDQQIRNMLGIAGGQGDKGGYAIVAQTSTGEGIYVQKLDENGLPITTTSTSDETLARIGGFGAENTIEKLPMGQAYKLYGISTRYAGLGTDEEIAKYKTEIKDMQNVARLLNASSLTTNNNFVGSEKLPGGKGVISTRTNTGIPINITVRKEGKGNVYVGRIMTGAGERLLEANTPQELITQINSF